MGKILTLGLWEGVGYDESNRGRNPEIHVGIFTNYLRDLVRFDSENFDLMKRRAAGNGLSPLLRKRGWVFLLMDRAKLMGMHYYQRLGTILGSLARGEDFGRELNVYVGGEYHPRCVTYAEGILAEISGIERGKIKVICGAKMDCCVHATHLADRTAGWLYTQRLIDLEKHPNRKRFKSA